MESIWSLYGVFMESLRSLYGVFTESLWSLYGVYMESMWSQYGVYMNMTPCLQGVPQWILLLGGDTLYMPSLRAVMMTNNWRRKRKRKNYFSSKLLYETHHDVPYEISEKKFGWKSLSPVRHLEIGVPQGSVLSPLLHKWHTRVWCYYYYYYYCQFDYYYYYYYYYYY
jgi:hypothetical protein